jgi:hypothetical protein
MRITQCRKAPLDADFHGPGDRLRSRWSSHGQRDERIRLAKAHPRASGSTLRNRVARQQRSKELINATIFVQLLKDRSDQTNCFGYALMVDGELRQGLACTVERVKSNHE